MSATMIADLPMDDRPRERLLTHGADTLSDAELLAILIGSGMRGKNALDLSRELLVGGLSGLARRDTSATSAVSGIGPAKAARIAAALEIGRRLAAYREPPRDPVRDPESLAQLLIARYSHHIQERLGAVFLDSKNRMIREREIYVGTLNMTTVSTRDIIRLALQENAAAVIVFHNHPSGDPAPSAEDLVFTRKMVEAGKLMSVDVLDHLILGHNRWVSLRQRGAM
jgi:DNA repair protein RadC